MVQDAEFGGQDWSEKLPRILQQSQRRLLGQKARSLTITCSPESIIDQRRSWSARCDRQHAEGVLLLRKRAYLTVVSDWDDIERKLSPDSEPCKACDACGIVQLASQHRDQNEANLGQLVTWEFFAEEGTLWIDQEREVAAYLMPSAELMQLVKVRDSSEQDEMSLQEQDSSEESCAVWNLTVHCCNSWFVVQA